jgi:hypothetical protein
MPGIVPTCGAPGSGVLLTVGQQRATVALLTGSQQAGGDMGDGTLAAGGSRWPADRYWLTACLALPLVDPPLVVLLSASEALGLPGVLGVLLVGLGNWWVLARVSRGVWSRSERNKRVFLGVVVSLALAIGFAYAEFFALIVIVCSQQACFS